MKYLKTYEEINDMAFSMNDIVKIYKSPIFGSFGYENYDKDIYKISGREKDVNGLLWRITSISNSNLKLFLRTNQLRKATKEELKQYKLETKVNKYNL